MPGAIVGAKAYRFFKMFLFRTKSCSYNQTKIKAMKKIEAIIRASKYDELKQSLHEIDVDFFSWWDVTGQGNDTKFKKEIFRGSIRETSLISRRLLSIVVRDIKLEETIKCILKHAQTGEVGDGKIFVSEISAAYRIRTGESGDESLFIKDSSLHAYDFHESSAAGQR